MIDRQEKSQVDDNELTSKSHWEKRQGEGVLKVKSFNLPMLNAVRKYIPDGDDGRLNSLEVGCVPGRYLLYFNKVLGYRVEGIDYVDEIKRVEATLRHYGIEDFTLHKQDFFKFQPHKQYDLVSSFGFIEHFKNAKEVVRLHADLVRKGGYLVLTVPNLNYIQRGFLKNSNPKLLESHNLEILKPEVMVELLGGNFEVKYAGYIETLRLYGRVKVRGLIWKMFATIAKKTTNLIEKCLVLSGLSFPNKYMSPHIAVVARKID